MRCLLLVIFSTISFANLTLLIWLYSIVASKEYLPETKAYSDALKAATELGRLDLATIVLSVLALVIVFGGLFAFLKLEDNAEKEARKEAKRRVEELLPEMVPGQVAIYMDFLYSRDDMEDIAQYVDESENEDG